MESNAEDPTSHLKKLADVQGIASTKVKYLALGAENGRMALDLLDTAFVRGQWLIFQNLQLVPDITVALQVCLHFDSFFFGGGILVNQLNLVSYDLALSYSEKHRHYQ